MKGAMMLVEVEDLDTCTVKIVANIDLREELKLSQISDKVEYVRRIGRERAVSFFSCVFFVSE